MRYDTIDKQLFIDTRKELAKHLKPKSIVVIQSNDQYPTNADGQLPLEQYAELLYFSGADQEETVLLLYPDAKVEKNREILFVRETNEHVAIWEGNKLTKEKATEVSGIKRVEWVQDFNKLFKGLIHQADNVYLSNNEHCRATTPVETRNDRFIKQCKKDHPLMNYERLSPITDQLRSAKHPIEIEVMQKACDITEKGFRRVLGFVKPGVGEWEIEAEFIYEFIKNKSKGFAYAPIIGTGSNACALHYHLNECVTADGDMILMDVAAEYANWKSDMTRTIPANGKFTARQKNVYNAVLRTMRHADSILRPGKCPHEFHKEVVAYMETELIGLGLIDAEEAKKQDDSKPLVRKYYMHGTSHPIGLVVHDVSQANAPYKLGQVLTIEPGIYIREENLGIRLENNYVIGEKSNTDLMVNIPIEVEEIEALMARNV